MSGTRLARLITRRLYFASAALSTYAGGLFFITDVEVSHADHVGNSAPAESSGSADLSAVHPVGSGLIPRVMANQDFAISDGCGNGNLKETA
jgi:hypothetical protein